MVECLRILEEYRRKKDDILTNSTARKKQNKEECPQRSFGEYRRPNNYPDRYKSQYDPRLDSAIPNPRDYYNVKHLKPISVAPAGQWSLPQPSITAKIDNVKMTLECFEGRPDQDPVEFVEDLETLATLSHWQMQDLPVIFGVYLKGSATHWFKTLEASERISFSTLLHNFLAKYKQGDINWSEEASFNAFSQLPYESIH